MLPNKSLRNFTPGPPQTDPSQHPTEAGQAATFHAEARRKQDKLQLST
jgi:hypothetical protein